MRADNPAPAPALSTRPATSRPGNPPFLALAAALLLVFAATRLHFFWYSPHVGLSQDSQSYLDLADAMRQGHLPRFIFRTPGYPLLIWAVTSVVNRWIAVIVVQNLLTFLSALCVVRAVLRLDPKLALPATVAMCGFLGSTQVMLYDISLLSDSLYTSMILLCLSAVLVAFAGAGPAWFGAASAAMACAILIRPAGSYFCVIYALVLAYMLWNRFGPRALLGFAAPFPAMLLAFCAYNAATIGQFVISPFTEANLAGATALFWEPDPRLAPVANKALEGLPDSYSKMGITQGDLALVRTSWDTDRLFEVYAKAYNRLIWSAGWGSGTRFGGGDYLHNRGYIRDVSVIAIRRHPALYAKYVWVNLVKFFGGIRYGFDVSSSLEYRERAPPALAAPADAPGPGAVERGVLGLQRAWNSIHNAAFQNVIWCWGYFAVMVLSAGQLLRRRGRHLGAFLLLVLTLIPLGASLVVCLVEVATDRYSYPTQFAYYLSVALSPLLFMPEWKDPSRTAPGEAP